MKSAVAALLRSAYLTDVSYRVAMATSLLGLIVTVVPVYFISRAVEPVVEGSIAAQGGDYFAFVLVGMATLNFVHSACSSLPGAVANGMRTGTFEALLTTPTPLPALFAGMIGYPLLWTLLRGAIFVGAGVLLGATVLPAGIPLALLILTLIVAAYLPVALAGVAMLLVFRTTGPFLQGMIVVSLLVGGVYYPSEVVPLAGRLVAAAVPLTYGLRALRGTLLGGAPAGAIAGDVAMLVLVGTAYAVIAMVLLRLALRHARRQGTLGQY